MTDYLQGITDAISGILASPAVQLGFRAFAIYWVLFWLAAAYWAYRDLQLRTDNAVVPYLAASFIIVFTPILFPAAIVIYRIVRPHEKIDEVYERTLAQEAMLAEIEASDLCPRCARRVREEWIACPSCRIRLSRPCPGCSRLVGLDWAICGWCGQELGGGPGTGAVAGAPDRAGELPATGAATAPGVAISAAARATGGQRSAGRLPER